MTCANCPYITTSAHESQIVEISSRSFFHRFFSPKFQTILHKLQRIQKGRFTAGIGTNQEMKLTQLQVNLLNGFIIPNNDPLDHGDTSAGSGTAHSERNCPQAAAMSAPRLSRITVTILA